MKSAHGQNILEHLSQVNPVNAFDSQVGMDAKTLQEIWNPKEYDGSYESHGFRTGVCPSVSSA